MINGQWSIEWIHKLPAAAMVNGQSSIVNIPFTEKIESKFSFAI